MKQGKHPKYGLNPTKVQCFVCREETNEVFLYGNDIPQKAPPATPVDFRICVVCEAKSESNTFLQETGIVFLEDGNTRPEWFGDGVWVPNEELDSILGEKASDCEIHCIDPALWQNFKKQNDGFDYDSTAKRKKFFVVPDE